MVESPLAVAGLTLVPVVRVSLNYWRGKAGVSCYGTKQPVGVVVVSPTDKRAFRIGGEEVPLTQFIQEVPEIRGLLGKI